jgi:uncharacterized OsmC-like protein
MEVVLNRLDQDFHFEAKGSSPIPVHIDAAEGIGGHNAGARPMELLLMGLGGWTLNASVGANTELSELRVKYDNIDYKQDRKSNLTYIIEVFDKEKEIIFNKIPEIS